MHKPHSVIHFIELNPQWETELQYLRSLLLETELTETIKWNFPCYMLNKKNVIGLGATKSYVGLWFFNGVFLADEAQKLLNAQEGKTKSLRQWRFVQLSEIEQDTDYIRAYIYEAIENQRAGKIVKPQANTQAIIIPPILHDFLKQNPNVKERFDNLSRSQRREFANYIHEAKRQDTKKRRLDKIIPMILSGQGLMDKYRK